MSAPGPQHAARAHRATRIATAFFVAALVVLAVGTGVAVTAVLAHGAVRADSALSASMAMAPPTVTELPVQTQTAAPRTSAPCDLPGVGAALAAGDDEAVVDAFGGGTALRDAVVAGTAPCIDLADPSRIWVVANKARPLEPMDYVPPAIDPIPGSRDLGGGGVRPVAAAALGRLLAAARDSGAGELAAASNYRSYSTQVESYASQVSQQGQDEADRSSARPGHSEHQTGLAADVVACGDGCTGLDGLAGTPQGDWVAAHSWEYGWIVRYVDGQTGTTGYDPEPWHLRYIGPALAAAYHDGGYQSLEAFWDLPAAPAYPG